MRLRKLSKKATVVTVFTAVVLVAGVAFAAWTATGTGSGRASSLTAQTVTVNAATGPADLFPGGTGDVFFTLTNTNPYAITFTSATVGTITSADTAACPSLNVVANGPSPITPLSLQVGASTTSVTLSIPDAVAMIHAAPDGCQNMAFTVALTLTGLQD